ncbi:MAG: hypothetical protein M0P58_03995 [Bacteroidales bacterium]|jgi:hypothetical protein|nr:hypothetical protein [Bacteroidales bacterium]
MKSLKNLYGLLFTVLLVAGLVFLAGCANKQVVSDCLSGQPYGFWAGLWHGIIAPIDLIAMLWRDDVSVFATNNNGAWYAFGFMIGSGGWGFLGGKGASKCRK